MSLEDRFKAALAQCLAGEEPTDLAVAVSGGSDSLALLGLACDWARDTCRIHAITVDHGLREGSAEEARVVTREALRMGASHEILKWQGWDGRGNLQAAARDARYHLMQVFCQARGIGALLVGHTQDDQAETVLLRLARGSGVDGLSAMAPGCYGRDFLLRPVLEESRQDLRVWLSRQGMTWAEDPSNDDPRFDRVRVRRILEHLDPLGLDATRLAETASAMARAQVALRARAANVAETAVMDHCGILIFDRAQLQAVEEETRLRLVAHGLRVLSGEVYKPRLASLSQLLEKAFQGLGGTLQGCRLIPSGDSLFLIRELNSVEKHICPADGQAIWDGRWTIAVKDDAAPGAVIRALNAEGIRQMGRPEAFPHAAWLSYPGIWQDGQLLAVPGVFNEERLSATYLGSAGFHGALLSH